MYCVKVLLGSSVVLDGTIEVVVLKSGRNSATLGIQATRDIPIERPTAEAARALNREHIARLEAKKRQEEH